MVGVAEWSFWFLVMFVSCFGMMSGFWFRNRDSILFFGWGIIRFLLIDMMDVVICMIFLSMMLSILCGIEIISCLKRRCE